VLLLHPLLLHWIMIGVVHVVWRHLQGERRHAHLIRGVLLLRIGVHHEHRRCGLGASHHSGARKIVVIVKVVEGIVEGTVDDDVVVVHHIIVSSVG